MKIRKTMSLKNRFILTSYLLIVISVVISCVMSYVLLGSAAKKYALQASKDSVQQKSEDINNRIWGLEATIRDLIYSRDLQRLLIGKSETDDYYMRSLDVSRIISRAANSLYMIDNIAVFSENGEMIGSMFEFDMGKQIQDYAWYDEAAQSTGDTVWLMDTVDLVKDSYGQHVAVGAVKKIRSVYASEYGKIGKDLGYIYMTLNLDSLLNFGEPDFSDQGKDIFVVDHKGRILGGSNRKAVGEKFLEPKELEKVDSKYIDFKDGVYLMTYTSIKSQNEFYVVKITDKGMILKDAHTAIEICGLLSVVLLIVFWYFSIHNANSLSKPIHLLEKEFEKVENGDFENLIKENTRIKEINNLFERFQVMAVRLDNLIHQVYEAKIKEQKLIGEARQAQLQSLQMQINPHFLYNTLDSINWMALMEGNDEVSKMILALGHLFRSNMDREQIFTSAQGEIENVKLYMYLEQVRFGGRLEYSIEAEEETLNAIILKHILQPLVENSIKYGIEPYNVQGYISISIKKIENQLVISVSDNGKGMSEDTLSSLVQLWKDIEKDEENDINKRSGVGIRNIMKRLWLCYGEKASFSVFSNENGTQTEIIFPFSTKKE